MQFVIISGMSGAGKSRAASDLEDLGFYCVDNMPAEMIPQFAQLCLATKGRYEKVALVTDIRASMTFDALFQALQKLDDMHLQYSIYYIEASTAVIIKRYKETRRKHPLDEKFRGCLHDAIAYERQQLLPVKGIADYYIETSYFSASQLKKQIREIFLENSSDFLSIKVTSFGFKYGVSTESDLVFDVRCLPNPYYIEELRHHTGCEACVQDYVMKFEQSQILLQKLKDLLDFLIPLYIQEGKSRLVIAFGCTGGKHRSITFTELIGDYLISKGMHVVKQHRDIGKDRP